MVGLWPLQEAYGGNDTSGNGNHFMLSGVSFPDDYLTPDVWGSHAAHFDLMDYANIQYGQPLYVQSFSWMAKVYPTRYAAEDLLTWMVDGAIVSMFLSFGSFCSYGYIPECSYSFTCHPTALSFNTWHTLAVTYDFPTNTLTLWENGESEVSTKDPCGTSIGTSQELYIGIRYRLSYVYIFYREKHIYRM